MNRSPSRQQYRTPPALIAAGMALLLFSLVGAASITGL
jgi:hypothetical protein